MNLRFLGNSAVSVLGTMLLASAALAQTRPAEPASPYGGVTVEEIIARVNDQIITSSDYNRAMKELDDEAHQHGASMQQISEAHKDLLRNLIDQQLWLSKGKELGITGETELINQLNDIRKQYHLGSLEDLQKAAEEQGVSFEDFKANIRNQIITREVMRDEVGAHIQITPGEVERYFEAHKDQYIQPESIRLSEILVSTGTPSATGEDDPAKVAAAKAKAEDIEAKLKAGADFAQLARTSSDGQTAAQGGDLGTYKRGQLAKVFEDATFDLPSGGVSAPIRTRQGYVIFKVVEHIPGGVPAFKDVQEQATEAYYESKMEPAIRAYLTKMREDAYIEIKPGYVDTGASPNARVVPISYAAYTPPAPKKKKKVERTRFRETPHFRQKSAPKLELANTEKPTKADKRKKGKTKDELAQEKPGKKEKIRYGRAPTKTLPSEPQGATEDAGAGSEQAQAPEPENPFEQAPPQHKTRFADRARLEKKHKKSASTNGVPAPDPYATPAPDAAEVAARQTQSAALGLGGNTSKKKKKHETTTGQKTRLSQKKKDKKNEGPLEPTPIPQVQGAPAPQAAPSTQAPAPQQ
ncbi:MAG: peptidylprolyl isomerase [Acidobacteriota bacterium]